MLDIAPSLVRLMVALGIGLLIGLEREWRAQREGSQVHTGLRSIGLIGLAGGVAGVMPAPWGPVALGGLVLALGIHSISERLRPIEGGAPEDVTTIAAAVAAALLGALAGLGELETAAAGGVGVAALLFFKPTLHRWVSALNPVELHAVLLFLVISVVALPVLPDRGFGPGEVLNPYRIWWIVVLISGLSFAGYAAVRIVGPRKGHLLTALLGGLVSSTAVTASLAGMARERPREAAVLATGIGLACAVMSLRVAVVAGAIAPPVGLALAWPMGLMAATGLAGAAFTWHSGPRQESKPPKLANPFDLRTAIKFAAMIAGVMLLARLLKDRIGDTGIYALAAVSGLADVDAVTITAAQEAARGGAVRTASIAIVIAAAANTVFKAGLAAKLGGRALAGRVAVTLGAMLVGLLAGLALPAPG